MERGWDYTRTLMAMQHNTAMGAKQAKKGTDMMKLPIIDRIGKTMNVDRVSPDTKHFLINKYKEMRNGS